MRPTPKPSEEAELEQLRKLFVDHEMNYDIEFLALILSWHHKRIVAELEKIVGGYHVGGLQWAGSDPNYIYIKDRLEQLRSLI